MLGGIGQLPGIAAGLGGNLHLDVGSWALELGAGVWPATQASADSGYAEISLSHGSLSVCPWTLSTAAHLCLGFELGRISVEPRNFAVMTRRCRAAPSACSAPRSWPSASSWRSPCRCSAPEGESVDEEDLCACPDGFACIDALLTGPDGIGGGYCVRSGT